MASVALWRRRPRSPSGRGSRPRCAMRCRIAGPTTRGRGSRTTGASRSVIGGSRSSTSRPPATADGERGRHASGSPTTARSTTTPRCAASSRPRGTCYRSHTDTETILHLYEEEGPRCVERLHGMFAFAIWDTRRRELFLARDRLGVKPLYYASPPGGFVFASEIKALLEHPSITARPRRGGVRPLPDVRCTPAPMTLFAGHQQARPRRADDGHAPTGGSTSETYWTPFSERAAAEVAALDDDGARGAAASSCLRASVGKRMMSDVPFGVFLSGGVDSSTNVALMAELMTSRCRRSRSASHGERALQRARVGAQRRRAVRHRPPRGDRRRRTTSSRSCPSSSTTRTSRSRTGCASRSTSSRSSRATAARSSCRSARAPTRSSTATTAYVAHGALRALREPAPPPPAPMRAGAGRAAVSRHEPRRPWLRLRERARERRRGPPRVLGRCDRLVGRPQGARAPERRRAAPPGQLRRSSTSCGGRRSDRPRTSTCCRDDVRRAQRRLSELLLMRVDKMTMATSVEARVPFLDHELVEFAMALPRRRRSTARRARRSSSGLSGRSSERTSSTGRSRGSAHPSPSGSAGRSASAHRS